jgi:4-carboxymuconolactone decarboxylase
MVELPKYLNLALDDGVKPGEISEIVTHLAFYSGWANAMSAVPIARNLHRAQRRAGSAPARLGPASSPRRGRRSGPRYAGRAAVRQTLRRVS